MDDFGGVQARLSDLTKTFLEKEEYLEKKIAFLEEKITVLQEFKRAATRYDHDYLYEGGYDDDDPYEGCYDDDDPYVDDDYDDPYEGCYDDNDPYEGCYDDDDPYVDDDYDDPYEACYDDDAHDYDDLFTNTIDEGYYDDDDDYNDLFTNTISNRSTPTGSLSDLTMTFLEKEEYLEKKNALLEEKITFLEEFKRAATRYRHLFTNTISNRSTPTGSPDRLHVPSDLEAMLQDQSSTPHDIPLQDLKEITDNFSDERILGQGGFGVIYKGVLRNGEIIVVKKTVSSLMPGQMQFESEVYHLMTLKHPNIVRCIGYCYETRHKWLEYNGQYVFAEMPERLLCLEHLPKGSLDKYLSDESSGLDWSTRFKIIEGICCGLCHLHEQIDKPIIHMDLKPANILLDDSLVPKITDFGLSRLFGQQQTICTSSRDGTFGYMPPEFLHRGTITPKLDIFSLGVIIIEIITGHRDYPGFTGTSSDDFIELALEKWRNVLQRSPGYGSLERDCEKIKRCIQVGLICVNPDRTKRPPIAKIINMLQGSENIDYDISNEAA